MTKNDLELIAQTIYEKVPYTAARQTTTAFADALAAGNPAFDREKFCVWALYGPHSGRTRATDE
jgi:hypothetical protein